MTSFQIGQRVYKVNQARFGEHDRDFRSILASIRALNTGDPQT